MRPFPPPATHAATQFFAVTYHLSNFHQSPATALANYHALAPQCPDTADNYISSFLCRQSNQNFNKGLFDWEFVHEPYNASEMQRELFACNCYNSQPSQCNWLDEHVRVNYAINTSSKKRQAWWPTLTRNDGQFLLPCPPVCVVWRVKVYDWRFDGGPTADRSFHKSGLNQLRRNSSGVDKN